MRLVSISLTTTLVAGFLVASCTTTTTTTANYSAAIDNTRTNHAEDGACSVGCLRFFLGNAAVQATCEQVCSAVEAQPDAPCGQALLGSSFERLTLLSYSSGHVVESLAIILGAVGGGNSSSTAEDAAFFSDLHLNDRGSPQACGDIEDAHYCLGQLPLVASVGVCLPQSCDSVSVLALLASVNASSLLPTDDDTGSGGASFARAASFTCGNELRIHPDAGTVSVLALIGVLVGLVLVGTALDYGHRCRHSSHQAAKQQQQEQQQQQQHQQQRQQLEQQHQQQQEHQGEQQQQQQQQRQQHQHQHQQQSFDSGDNGAVGATTTGRTPSPGTWTRNTYPNGKASGRSNTAWATNGVEEGKDIGPHQQYHDYSLHHHHRHQQQEQMELGGGEADSHSNNNGQDFLEHVEEDPAREPLLPSSRVGNSYPAHFHRSPSSSSYHPSKNITRSLNELTEAGESGNGGQDAVNSKWSSCSKWSGLCECLECFSVMLNMDRLVAPPRAGDEFGALDGVRTLSMMWVVLGHVLVYALSGPGFTNTIHILPRNGEGLLARLTAQVLPGGFLAVDTFFLMSGFLLSSILLPKLESGSLGRWLWIAKAYLHRYLRLTPTLAFTTFFMWKVLPLLGEGPGWWPLATGQADRCQRYWWAEITYLSNVIPWPPLASGCLGVSWYLSDDTMFFVAGVPLVALYHKRPRAGVAAAFLIIASSCIYTLLWLGFRGDVRFSFFNAASGNGWVEAYASPWARCPVYVVGLLCGFAWHTKFRGRVGREQEHIPTATAAAPADASLGDDDTSASPASSAEAITRLGGVEAGEGLLPPGYSSKNAAAVAAAAPAMVAVASAALLALPVYGSYWAYQDLAETRVSPWADHLYLAFSRPAWALGVALMCGLCFCGRGGFVSWVLTRPSWTTPSRLTYCAYLTHPSVLTIMYGWRDSAVTLTWVELSVTYMGVVVGTFAGATALHLLVEAPVRNLESWVRRSLSAERKRETGA